MAKVNLNINIRHIKPDCSKIETATATIPINNNVNMKHCGVRYYKLAILVANLGNIVAGFYLCIWALNQIQSGRIRPEQQSIIFNRGLLSFFIAVALFMVITALIGCGAVLKEHTRALAVQSAFYLLIILFEVFVMVGAAWITAWDVGNEDMRLHFNKNATLEENMERQVAWDNMQRKLDCCGVDGPHDYELLHREFPLSCCPEADDYQHLKDWARQSFVEDCLAERSYYRRGCDAAVKGRKHTREIFAALYGCCIIVMQTTVVSMTGGLVRRMRRRERRRLQHNLQAHFET